MLKEVMLMVNLNKKLEIIRKLLPSLLKLEDFSRKILNSMDHSFRKDQNWLSTKMLLISFKNTYMKVLEESPNLSTKRALLKS